MIDLVVKIGGALLAQDGALDRAARALRDASARSRLVAVPGGGPFADTVRAADRELALGDDAAHWMAILAMSQYGHLLATHIPRACLVEDRGAAVSALDRGAIPVLAPYRWLRDADPLPHTWTVTSDSIAAWLAGALGAPRLVLVKPVRGALHDLADPYFARALPPGIAASVVSALDVTAATLLGE